MISAIFQTETTALESQVLALQAQIDAHTERIALLNDAGIVAGDSLESLKAAIHKISSLAPSAVSNLRAAVLTLFTGNDGDDNQPNPEPQPDDDGEARSVELLAGQSSPFASPLASPLACCLPAVPEPNYFDLVPVSDALAYFLPLSSIGTGMYVNPKMPTVIEFEPLPLKVPIPVIRIFITGKILSKPE